MTRVIHIRSDLSEFAGLKLARDTQTGLLSYSVPALKALLRANNVDPASIIGNEEATLDLLIDWYKAHRAAGGEPDPAMEQVIAEVMAEEEFGKHRVQRGSILPQ